jgi:membrane protease YdiL (CAAX protease family)
MNEIADAVEVRRADSAALAGEQLPPPWGFWSTLCWVLAAFAVAAIIEGGLLWLIWGEFNALPDIEKDPSFPFRLILINLAQIVVLALAARLARWPAGLYLGLVRPRHIDLLQGLIAVAVLIAALEILTRVLGRESVTPFQAEAYQAARAAGLVPLLWLAFVIAAPVGEEVVFRGFLFRGWAASRLGVSGTILVTSIIFSAEHALQYDWFGVAQTFCMGALFGWLRWRSGSTLVTIVLHVGVNFVATGWAAFKAQGLV